MNKRNKSAGIEIGLHVGMVAVVWWAAAVAYNNAAEGDTFSALAIWEGEFKMGLVVLGSWFVVTNVAEKIREMDLEEGVVNFLYLIHALVVQSLLAAFLFQWGWFSIRPNLAANSLTIPAWVPFTIDHTTANILLWQVLLASVVWEIARVAAYLPRDVAEWYEKGGGGDIEEAGQQNAVTN